MMREVRVYVDLPEYWVSKMPSTTIEVGRNLEFCVIIRIFRGTLGR